MRGWLLLALLAGCPYGRRPMPNPPEAVVNIRGVNSPYDDYNAAKPAQMQTLIFSTNRASRGKHLDVYEVGMWWDRDPYARGEAVPYLPRLMSDGDERGPLLAWEGERFGGYTGQQVLLLSSGRGASLDLYYALLQNEPTLVPLHHLNTPSNEAYLTLPYDKRALFASDRDGGKYDVYEVTFASEQMTGDVTKIERVAALSSAADDTAPYVDAARNLVVFASNRSGSYDLYCANRKDGAWTKPLPLAFNTTYDEFRPSLFSIGDANFLVFSSNRPGGAGGYDLYTVRFDACR